MALAAAGTRPLFAHICAECVKACEGIFAQHARKSSPLDRVPTPRELVAHLDDYIIGQERVKKTLAVAVVNHLACASSAARSTTRNWPRSRSPRDNDHS